MGGSKVLRGGAGGKTKELRVAAGGLVGEQVQVQRALLRPEIVRGREKIKVKKGL